MLHLPAWGQPCFGRQESYMAKRRAAVRGRTSSGSFVCLEEISFREQIMFRRLLIIAGFAGLLVLPATSAAQDYDQNNNWRHGEVGVYGDLFRVTPSGAPTENFLGLGGRVGINAAHWVAPEGEMNYNFEQTLVTTNSSGFAATSVTANVRPLTGLFGRKFTFWSSHGVRPFLLGKAGFIDLATSCNAPAGSPSTSPVAFLASADRPLTFRSSRALALNFSAVQLGCALMLATRST
jgi:hypothetical protein